LDANPLGEQPTKIIPAAISGGSLEAVAKPKPITRHDRKLTDQTNQYGFRHFTNEHKIFYAHAKHNNHQ
jgi:hypothetical protein